MTMLVGAATCGHTSIIELLLQRKAEVDRQNSDGITALMSAAMNNHPAIVKRLLQAGARLDLRNVGNCTALQIANSQGNTECVSAIREHLQSLAAQSRAQSWRMAPSVFGSNSDATEDARSTSVRAWRTKKRVLFGVGTVRKHLPL